VNTYELRDGCESPTQPKVQQADWKHPRYAEYLRYRSAMSMQLVRALPFDSWLRQREEDLW
jgi:hypothetical protein